MQLRASLVALSAILAIVIAGPILPHSSGAELRDALEGTFGVSPFSSHIHQQGATHSPSATSVPSSQLEPSSASRSSLPSGSPSAVKLQRIQLNRERARFVARERARAVKTYALKAGWMPDHEREKALRKALSSSGTRTGSSSSGSRDDIPPSLAHLYDSDGRPYTQREMSLKGGFTPKVIPRSSEMPPGPPQLLRAKRPLDELTRSGQFKRQKRQAEVDAFKQGTGPPPRTRKEQFADAKRRKDENLDWLRAQGIPHNADPSGVFSHPESSTRHVSEEEKVAHYIKVQRGLAYASGDQNAAVIKDYSNMSERSRYIWKAKMKEAQARQGLRAETTAMTAPAAKSLAPARASRRVTMEREKSLSGESESAGDSPPPWANHPKRPRTQMEVVGRT